MKPSGQTANRAEAGSERKRDFDAATRWPAPSLLVEPSGVEALRHTRLSDRRRERTPHDDAHRARDAGDRSFAICAARNPRIQAGENRGRDRAEYLASRLRSPSFRGQHRPNRELVHRYITSRAVRVTFLPTHARETSPVAGIRVIIPHHAGRRSMRDCPHGDHSDGALGAATEQA
jgi:hypothetical protein